MLLLSVAGRAALLSGSGVPAALSAAHIVTKRHQARSGGEDNTQQQFVENWREDVSAPSIGCLRRFTSSKVE
jgi:hypothetical protein